MDIKTSTGIIGGSTAIGGAIGYALYGPDGVKDGSQIGAAMGAQIISSVKGAEDGEDENGRTIRKIGTKIIGSLDTETLKNKSLSAAIDVMHVWSTFMLCGYAINIATSASAINRELLEKFCKDAYYSNLPCIAKTMTTVSFDGFLIATTACMFMKAKNLMFPEKPTLAQQRNIRPVQQPRKIPLGAVKP